MRTFRKFTSNVDLVFCISYLYRSRIAMPTLSFNSIQFDMDLSTSLKLAKKERKRASP